MNDLNHIVASILNVSPSKIESIQSMVQDGANTLFVTFNKENIVCPRCDNSLLLSKGFYKRKVFLPHYALTNVTLVFNVRRYVCRTCHHSFSDTKYMTPKGTSVSYASIQAIMELLKDPCITFKKAAELTNLSETTVVRIFDKHCHLKRYPFPEVLCIDEVYTKNNEYKSKYSCLFYNFYKHSIIDVTPCRRKEYLHHYLQSIPQKERENVKFICIDMYLPYKQLARMYFKKAIICVDSFHVIQHINDDLSKIRIRLMKSYPTDSIEYYLLKSWKNLLFTQNLDNTHKGKYNKRLQRVVNYNQLLELVLDIHPDLRLGFQLKEKYMEFNRFCSFEAAEEQLDYLISMFITADIEEYKEFTTLLQNWRCEIINSFSHYRGKRINNSVSESLNAKVSTLLFNTKGIRNNERRRKRIMYAINKEGFIIK